MLLLGLLLLPQCEALVAHARTPLHRCALGGLGDAARLSRCAISCGEDGFSPEETGALQEASESLEQCGAKVNVFGNPETFFSNIRAPEGEMPEGAKRMPDMIDRNPDAETWAAVRERWPVLSSRSDEELNAAVRPIREIRVTLAELQAKNPSEKKFFGLF
jgi:hypothetical protein